MLSQSTVAGGICYKTGPLIAWFLALSPPEVFGLGYLWEAL